QAHHAVGTLVGRLVAGGRSLDSATVEELAGAHPAFRAEDMELVDPEISVQRRRSPGGGGPDSVRRQVAALREQIRARPSLPARPL
ncbi:MAG: hypothetical protein WB239_12675, partial [Acidimicrobiia bacterium]